MAQTVGATEPRKEVTGLHRMTQKGLRDLCKKDKLYQTPRLNDVLYLHYQGYQYIECLEEYTELKCLWLECNAISDIEGLENQSKLKCLFLQNNLIKRIDNLRSCPELDTLNLSSNHIRMIENIGSDILPVLNTLNISSNYLKDSDSLAHLVQCKTLAVLDLSNNRIEDILVVKIFEQMPCLKVLVLQGNPVVSRLPQYRKTLILACKLLTYLDSRPVFPRDRACAEAWKKDGYEGERREQTRWIRAERKKMRDSVNYTIALRNRHRPPDQQDALITSTDSESEQEADKRAEISRIKADVENGSVDDVWREVEGNESSGNSSLEDDPQSGAIDKSKSKRRPLEGRPKILDESQLPENQEKDEKELDQQRGRRVLIEEMKLESLNIEGNSVEKDINADDKDEESLNDEVDEFKDDVPKTLLQEIPELISEVIQKEESSQPGNVVFSNDMEVSFKKLPELIQDQEIQQVNDCSQKAIHGNVLISGVMDDQPKVEDDKNMIVIQKIPELIQVQKINEDIQIKDNDSKDSVQEDIQTNDLIWNEEKLKDVEDVKNIATIKELPELIQEQDIGPDIQINNDDAIKESPHEMLPELIPKNDSGQIVIEIENKIPDEEERVTVKGEETANESLQPKQLPEQDTDSELGYATDLEQSTQALADVVNNRGSPTPMEIKQKCVDEMYEHYGSEIFVNQPESIDKMLEGETFDYEMDLKVCCVEPRKVKDTEGEEDEDIIIPKTQQQLDYEEECAEANEKVEHDMQELSDNLDEDLNEIIQSIKQLHAEHEDLRSEFIYDEDGEEAEEEEVTKMDPNKCVELTTVVRSLRIIEEFSVRRERVSEDQKKHQTTTELKYAMEEARAEELEQVADSNEQVSNEIDELDYAFAKALDDASDDVPKRVFGAGCDAPSYKWQREECMRQLKIREVQTEFVDEDIYQVKPLTNRTSAEEAERICEEMNKKLAADEESLRELLEQLEDEIDVCHDIDDTLGKDVNFAKLPEPEISVVCRALLDELIDELQYREIMNGQNFKCIDFGLIESDEEYSYSADPKVEPIVPIDLQDPASGKSLRECVDAFGDFLSAVKERKHIKATQSSEKVQAAKKLLKSRMLPDVSPEELDAVLAKQEEKTKRRVSEMASRCYAKRDSYEDTLEVIDNRLMIVKKDTGEMKELPPPPALISDSESESDASDDEDVYDTADDDPLQIGQNDDPNSRKYWAKPCLPEPRERQEENSEFSVEDAKDDEAEHSLDQFYSLEARSAFNSLDSEFLEKLDLNKVIGSDGEITVEGMHDYMNMQTKSDPPLRETPLTLEKEDEMLRNLIDRKKAQEERERKLQELENASDLNKRLKFKIGEVNNLSDLNEPNKLEHQLVTKFETLMGQHTQEPQMKGASNVELSGEVDKNPIDSRELKWEQEKRQYQLRELSNPDDMGPIKLTLGSCTLYERKSQIKDPLEDNDGEALDQTILKNDSETEVKDEIKINKDNYTADINGGKPDEKAQGNSEEITTHFLSASIDDDIISDTSTDYESGEEIPVVEPPKLPEGALNELITTQFEDGLKRERESEEALRKELFSLPLRAWASREKDLNVSKTTEEPDTGKQNTNEATNMPDKQCAETEDDQSVSDSDTETEGAFGELAHNAKVQWAKISKRLSSFIDSDDMKLLNDKEFDDDSNDDDEDELIEDLATLHEYDEDIFEECVSQLDNSQYETECKHKDIMQNTIINNSSTEDDQLGTKDEGEPQLPIELKPKVSTETADENNAKETNNSQSEQPSNAKPTIRLEYFEAVEPDKQSAEFDDTGELKTEEIECNLEILNDDGDAVVKEINVNAQVTYEFQ
ncbi:dynein axonemal assembly factor 1 homolog [Drosophila sulfurigaster albostrigata]|uniref:dynein axonemal assembly factor 1 homolog n=1 Tax=Drosophila sulfurigaster albostrigata TaxID=89887 RepID=UPI002D218408|nr:dynein axonemal assembly factor 1 homolog [Drosophila sulfurigaster albostrigata]